MADRTIEVTFIRPKESLRKRMTTRKIPWVGDVDEDIRREARRLKAPSWLFLWEGEWVLCEPPVDYSSHSRRRIFPSREAAEMMVIHGK